VSRALFTGKDLAGWQQVGPGFFVVKDGMMKTEGGMGMLWYTREKIAHATVRVVFKLTAKESDSGVFIRIPEKPTEPWMPINRGYRSKLATGPYAFSRAQVCSTRLPKHWHRQSSQSGNEHDGNHDRWAADNRLSQRCKVTTTEENPYLRSRRIRDPDRGARPDSLYRPAKSPRIGRLFSEVSVTPLSKPGEDRPISRLAPRFDGSD
jgi:hypothetical protein